MAPDAWRIPPGKTPAPVQARSTLDADEPFAYVQHLLTLTREELVQEIATRRALVQVSHKPLDQAKLALALALPNQNQRETTKALVAISEVPRDSPQIGGPATSMLNYVETLLAWQARQEETLQSVLQSERAAAPASSGTDAANLQNLAQRLRSDLRRNETQVETLTQRLREEKNRADSLQQKLEALGSLERSLAERKQPKPEGAR